MEKSHPLDFEDWSDYSPESEELEELKEYDDLLLAEEEYKKLLKKEIEERKRQKEIPALIWLAKEIKIDPKKLAKVLSGIRDGPNPYKVIRLKKKNGAVRIIHAPSQALKEIQKKINKHILAYQPRTPNVFGFSGGNIAEAIKPHLNAKSILLIDIKNAFPSVLESEIFDFFIDGRETWYSSPGMGYKFSSFKSKYSKLVKFKPGYMSWYAARIITQLTTYQGKLPQGPPTSPRLFDLIFRRVDEKLLIFAKKAELNYTRYADNIFFSSADEEFPNKIKNGILRRIRRKGFRPHKIETKKLCGEKQILRMLGLNITERKVYNTRDFKRRLRLAIHRVNWLLDNELRDTEEFDTASSKLRGQMGFAQTNTLPKRLLHDYSNLLEKIN